MAKIKRRNRQRLALPNGASCTVPHVNPENWKTKSASVASDWYIKTNYYDAQGNKRPITRKTMNCWTTLLERQAATKAAIELLLRELQEEGYNPFKKDFIEEAPPEPPKRQRGADGDSPLPRALAFAVIKRYKYRKRRTPTKGAQFDKVLADVCSYVRKVIAEAKKQDKAHIPINKVRRRDMLEIVEAIAQERDWGYASWNNCLAYLKALWETLITYEVAESNPVAAIEDQTPEPKKRRLLTDAERTLIKKHLSKVAPEFLRALMIFYDSGAREEEMCRVQGKHVDLKAQEFTIEIRKGNAGYRPSIKAITAGAVKDWKEALRGCGPEDYIFSDDWKPGPNCNGGEKYNRWWKKYVKEGLGIDADMYALKHLRTTKVARKSKAMAADFNSHVDERMNEKHYDQMSEKEKLEERKRQQERF